MVELCKPSYIQQRGIIPIVKGRNVILHSNAGTGKTYALSIGILQAIDTTSANIQAIVLSPTREIAYRTVNIFRTLGHYMEVQVISLIGGSPVGEDISKVERGAHVIAGTPGRVYEMIRRHKLMMGYVKMLVIDEADDILSRGSEEHIYGICSHLLPSTQIVCVSSTIPREVLAMTEKFMTDPIEIVMRRDKIKIDLKQYFVAVEKEEWKFDTLCDLYETLSTIDKSVIYCNTRRKSEWLASKMIANNFTVSYIHGDIPQNERNEIMNSFCSNGGTRVLIATDSFGRGIDVISQIPLVINYDMPVNPELYIKRIYRCGSFGFKAVIINLAHSEDISILRDIEQFYSIQIDELPMNIATLF